MDFGQSNVELGQKMANGQLLFLPLAYIHVVYAYRNNIIDQVILVCMPCVDLYLHGMICCNDN